MSRVLLTLTAERCAALDPATDLGFLLHKHPDRLQRVDLPVGAAHVFYPEASDERCTVALLLEVDPVALVRDKRFGGERSALAHYIDDRPYAASSLLSVALAKVFSTARSGRCDARPDLPGARLPLTVRVSAVPCAEGPALVRRLFEPLGWDVDTAVAPLDANVPAWGDAPYVDLTLDGEHTVAAALGHLYVLLPVLDDAKHYWVSADEVDKLVRAGGDWLARHPERDLIVRRSLAHQREFVADAAARLAGDATAARRDRASATPGAAGPASTECSSVADSAPGAPAPSPVLPLRRLRREAVTEALRSAGARDVVDLGCGEGALVADLLADPFFTHVTGVDVSAGELARAAARLNLDRMPDQVRSRLTLRQSSATYRDAELVGRDAIVLTEVVEHVDPDRLGSLERAVFGHAHPVTVVVTTPNADVNATFADLPPGSFRHPDHRFEWGRDEFTAWCSRVGETYGCAFTTAGIGAEVGSLGSPTQMAVFTRAGSGAAAAPPGGRGADPFPRREGGR